MLKSTNCLLRSNNMGAGCLFIQTGANLLDNDKMAVVIVEADQESSSWIAQ